MKKLDKYIQKANFVKVYIGDAEGQAIRHFDGFIFSYSDEYVFMCDISDFNYDGLVVFRKSDIIEVKYTESEMFFEKILKAENILRNIRFQKRENPFLVGSLKRMLEQLKELKIPVIFECLYDDEEQFLIGPIESTDIDKINIKYFNSTGEFDEKLMQINFNDITFLRFDSPYANLFYKYTDKTIDYSEEEADVIMEIDETMPETTKKDKKSKELEKLPKKKKKSKKEDSSKDLKKKKKSSKKDKDSKKKSKKSKKDEKSKEKKSKKDKSKGEKAKKSKKDKASIKAMKVKKSKKDKKKLKKKLKDKAKKK